MKKMEEGRVGKARPALDSFAPGVPRRIAGAASQAAAEEGEEEEREGEVMEEEEEVVVVAAAVAWLSLLYPSCSARLCWTAALRSAPGRLLVPLAGSLSRRTISSMSAGLRYSVHMPCGKSSRGVMRWAVAPTRLAVEEGWWPCALEELEE